MFDVQMYKDLSMYDYAMDVYQKTMYMKHDQGVEHYDVQQVIDHLQFILDTDKTILTTEEQKQMKYIANTKRDCTPS